MFPPLNQDKAATILKDVISKINEGKIKIEQVTKISEERKNQGIMIGVLVCLDKSRDKSRNEVILLTNSGTAKTMRLSSEEKGFLTYVEPIVSASEIEEALSENDRAIHELTDEINKKKAEKSGSDEQSHVLKLKKFREELCSSSLKKVHSLYSFYCIDGKRRSLKEICSMYNGGKLPPTGTGECCAPKLFDHAFKNGLLPISLAETMYDFSSAQTGAIPKLFSPCDERCGIILPAQLGLKILYQDDSICIVNKQSGVLSVPGRTEEKKDCIESRFKRLFGDKVEVSQPAVHRLDMETSGIMILAFTKEAHRFLNKEFEEKKVKKEYVALLDGVLFQKGIEAHGIMELYFRLDVENRPHQIWDSQNGKKAVTEWEILGVERYHAPNGKTRNATRVLFKPHTGRTHQLRLASADSHGFDVPIIGDTLYGKCEEGERLMLHAKKITFTHPKTLEKMTIDCESDF